jgi:hypothetical protein
VPDNQIERTEDLWADLSVWLHQAAISVRGPYGEVLRAATAISAADATLGDSMSAGFAAPARAILLERSASESLTDSSWRRWISNRLSTS